VSRRSIDAAVLLGYAFAAVLIFGRGALPGPTTHVVGDAGADKTIYLWSMRWWPHALARGHDPFDANVVWVPHGIDLSWATSVPLLSLATWPLTALWGPVAVYDVAVLSAAALSAWAAYFLAKDVTGAFWPSVVAGWLFGFSAYVIGHMVGHLNLVFLPFVPLSALLVLRHLRRTIANRRFVILLSLVLAGQFWTSAELYVDLLLVGVVFAATCALWSPSLRSQLRRTAGPTIAAVSGSLILGAPYLWHAFIVSGTDNAPIRSPYSESADLLNYVVPTHLIWLQIPGSSRIAAHFTATGAERGAYLSVPLLLLVAWFLWSSRRSRAVRGIAVGLAVTIIASLGAGVRLDGHALVPAPWKVLAVLPVTRTLLPIRMTLFVALVCALLAAASLASPGGTRARGARWALALAAVAFLFANPSEARWSSAVPNPAFFRTVAAERQIHPGETILVLPYGAAGWSLLWQAEDGFRYRLIGGHFGRRVTPAERSWSDVYQALGPGPSSAAIRTRFARFLTAHHVSEIVVAPHTTFRVRRLVSSLGIRPVHADDVLVYRVV
jgi:hypothetical protein